VTSSPSGTWLGDLAATARALLDSIYYMTLATVDADGSPRVSPVYLTPHEYTDFYWVSRPDAQHSRNLVRDQRAMAVVYDSTVPVGAAEAVYLTGRARQILEAELPERCSVAFSRRGGASVMRPHELGGDAPLRLYCLHIHTAEVLIRGGHPTLGNGRDRRVGVTLT
jgi:hypothetical protein